MNGRGPALRRARAVEAVATVLWALGVGAVSPALAQGAPLQAVIRPVAKASIVGGSVASIAEFPFQVALYDPRAGSPAKGFFCGGVILDATHVATAAHCLFGERGQHSPPAEIEVLAGSTDLEPIAPGSVKDPVARATVDPAYKPATSDYDVGVLQLARPLWSGPAPALDGRNAIAPLAADAALATARTDAIRSTTELATRGAAAAQVTVSGWGDVSPQPGGSLSYPLRLHKVRLALVPTTLCEEEYATIEQAITPRMMCAGGTPAETGTLAETGAHSEGVRPPASVEGGRLPAAVEAQGHPDSCYGDSGGPIVAQGVPGATPAGDVLLGLVDFGNGCGQAGYPGVYVRVADPAVARFLGAGPPLASAGRRPRSLCQTGGRGRAGSGAASARGQRVRRGGDRRRYHRRRRCA